jgi:hypothetical protein
MTSTPGWESRGSGSDQSPEINEKQHLNKRENKLQFLTLDGAVCLCLGAHVPLAEYDKKAFQLRQGQILENILNPKFSNVRKKPECLSLTSLSNLV